jgi:hypothetical protein
MHSLSKHINKHICKVNFFQIGNELASYSTLGALPPAELIMWPFCIAYGKINSACLFPTMHADGQFGQDIKGLRTLEPR